MAVNETLLPCPFCGDKAVLGSAGGNSEVDGYRRAHTVTCKGCGMHKLTFSRPYEGPSEAEAIVAVISAWNTRSDSSQARLSEAVKVLEEAKHLLQDISDGVMVADGRGDDGIIGRGAKA